MDDIQTQPLVFRINEKLLQTRPPRLTLAATLTALRKQVRADDLDANFVVNILDENRLLPYMISHRKNLSDVSLGRNTNASKIGDLIVSEECIKGTYELCISFLEFVLDILRKDNYKDTTRTMLASVTYMANEIYTCHHIWTYKNISDMTKISCLCTEIFHHIIANIREPTETSQYSELEIVCILSLSQNQAHKQLLDVIVEGKSSIEKSIEELSISDELSLRNLPNVTSVRQSLFIFNKLFLHSKHLKQYFCDSDSSKDVKHSSTSGQQLQASGSSAFMTNIEKALFDTSVRPGCLQYVFSFIYQKKDSVTACLAVDLIKNVAKKFSMSLMASLGSSAEKVCEFFVECLASKESSVDLEVAILDLLSTCVKHQPGLIELFLNFKKESDKTSKSSLDVVMDLLKECRTRGDGHKLLHTYMVKFLLTFWRKHHSAIEQLDKADEFWDSLVHPLLEFISSERVKECSTSTNTTVSSFNLLDDKLNSYILMILAREIFCLNANISERKINPNLTRIFDDLSSKGLLSKYSSFLKQARLLLTTGIYKSEEYSRVLNGWRDFLVSFAKFKPFETSLDVQDRIISDLLFCLSAELQLGSSLDKERVATTGETLLLIWTKWMSKTEACSPDKFDSLQELLYLVDSVKEYLPFLFLLTFQSIMNLYLIRNDEFLRKSTRSFNLIVPALQLVQFSLRVMDKSVNEQSRKPGFNYQSGLESRLCLTSLMALRFTLDVSKSHLNIWIDYLHNNLNTDYLVQFLTLLINKRAGAEVCLSLIEMLLCLSSIRETGEYMSKTGLLDSLARLYFDSEKADQEWLAVYHHLIRLNASMMVLLDKQYMSTAVDFISMHCIRICEVLESHDTLVRGANKTEVSITLFLIGLIQKHSPLWKKKDAATFEAISKAVGTFRYQLEVEKFEWSQLE